MGRKYAYLVLPAVLMPRVGFPHCFYSVRKSFSSKRERSSSFLERKVRERREPGGIFKCRSAERICRGQMSEAEKFSPTLARGWGSTEECLGVKYDCFVLPTVLMPRSAQIGRVGSIAEACGYIKDFLGELWMANQYVFLFLDRRPLYFVKYACPAFIVQIDA